MTTRRSSSSARLPEIGPKSAACVMMCSLDRPAFPVDAHVGRVLERLGTFRACRDRARRDRPQDEAAAALGRRSAVLRYPLHVNLLVHGRRDLPAGQPRCGRACISASDVRLPHRSGSAELAASRDDQLDSFSRAPRAAASAPRWRPAHLTSHGGPRFPTTGATDLGSAPPAAPDPSDLGAGPASG